MKITLYGLVDNFVLKIGGLINMKITMALVIFTVILEAFAFYQLSNTSYLPILLVMVMSVIIVISWFFESRAVAARSN